MGFSVKDSQQFKGCNFMDIFERLVSVTLSALSQGCSHKLSLEKFQRAPLTLKDTFLLWKKKTKNKTYILGQY